MNTLKDLKNFKRSILGVILFSIYLVMSYQIFKDLPHEAIDEFLRSIINVMNYLIPFIAVLLILMDGIRLIVTKPSDTEENEGTNFEKRKQRLIIVVGIIIAITTAHYVLEMIVK